MNARRVLVIAALPVAFALLTGCSSGGSSSPASSSAAAEPTSSEAAAGAVSSLPDPCSLLSSAEVTAIIPTAGSGTRLGAQANEAFAFDACTYGEITSGLVAVEVASPSSGFNPVSSSLSVAKNVVDLPDVPGGKGYDIGLMPGGGGVGYSVAAPKGNVLVVVSTVGGGEVTQAQKSAMAAALATAVGKA